MSDIVERLQERQASGVNCLCGNPVCDEAAVEILRLRAENEELKRLNGNCDRHIKEVHAAYALEFVWLKIQIEKLREALKPFEIIAQWDAEDRVLVPVYIIRAAAAALKETENK